MNYKELLQKYMKNVSLIAGDDFVAQIYKNPDLFSKEEWRELVRIRNDNLSAHIPSV